jgi:hypothetical protein
VLITSVPAKMAFCSGTNIEPLQPSPLCGMQRQLSIAILHLLLAIQKRASGKRHVTFCGEPAGSSTRKLTDHRLRSHCFELAPHETMHTLADV